MGMANFNYSSRDNCWVLSDKGGTELIRFGGAKVFASYVTSDGLGASSSFEPFYMKTTMTGAGSVGGRARFHLYTNVALGGWANALKAYTEFGASGRVTGLASALCAEIVLSAGTTQGNYAPLEAEIVQDTGASLGTATGFIYVNTTGTGQAGFETNGHLFIIGDDISSTADGFWEDGSVGAPANVDEWLSVKTPSGRRWIGLYNSIPST